MNTQTFEEQFPSLNGRREKLVVIDARPPWAAGEFDKDGFFIRIAYIKEFCIDKQKVREAIKITADIFDWTIEEQNALLQELGL